MTAWTEHIREFAKKHNISYACAMTQPECKATYHTAKQNQKKERNEMGAEDINRARKKPSKESKEAFKMSSEDILSRKALNSHTPLTEAIPAPKNIKDISVIKAKTIPKKKKKPLLIIESDSEEEYVLPPKKKENIQMTITEKKKRGRKPKYANEEERKKAKREQTLASNKKKREEKKAVKSKPKLIIESDSEDEMKGEGGDTRKDFIFQGKDDHRIYRWERYLRTIPVPTGNQRALTPRERLALRANKLDLKIQNDMESGRYRTPDEHPDYPRLERIMNELNPPPMPTMRVGGRPAGWNSDDDEGETYFSNGKMYEVKKGGDREIGKGLIAGYSGEGANGLSHIYPLTTNHILKMVRHLI